MMLNPSSNLYSFCFLFIALVYMLPASAAPRPDIAIQLAAPDRAYVGDILTVTVIAHNYGPAPAKRLRVRVQLPYDTVLLSNSRDCRFDNNRAKIKGILTCRVKSLKALGKAGKQWVMVLAARQVGILRILVSGSSLGRDYNLTNNAAEMRIAINNPSPPGEPSLDACGCPTGTLWHPEENHCMAVGLCNLDQYAGQCTTGAQCASCGGRRPLPGGVCP